MVLDGGNETIFHSEPNGMMEHVCGLLDFFSSVSNSISFFLIGSLARYGHYGNTGYKKFRGVLGHLKVIFVKFIYSEKATKFCEILPLLLTVCTIVKSKGKISQNFVAFSEYMNFKTIELCLLVMKN